ncbi:MAG: beta-phosphoglucomutase, partial [Haloplasmataceae bacterium]|nr:beta-phosphoglucomutase [Haloplasmataceae bacterium]
GVIFDLDGVIVSTDYLHYKAWKQISDQENIYFDEEINHRLRGVSRMQSLEIILERANKIYTESEKNQLAESKNAFYVELLRSLSPDHILSNVKELLAYLKTKEIKTAIGSSSKNSKIILKQVGLLNAFDAIADGNDITRSKPNPDVFLIAAKKIGLDPKVCAVIEDAEAGIIAAKRANMFAIAIGAAINSKEADVRINDLIEIKNLVL